MTTKAIDKKIFGTGFFGSSLNGSKQGVMNKRFIVPPFSVLDTTQGLWRDRKNAWVALGLKGEVGRREDVTSDEKGIAYRKTLNGFGKGMRKAYKLKELGIAEVKDYDYDAEETTGVSVFDPVLCEIMYKWFSKPGWVIGDPFAGGSTRGIVAAMTDRSYVGVEVREPQVEANIEQAVEILGGAYEHPKWILGDSSKFTGIIENTCGVDFKFDLLFQCGPYFDLEVYSSDNKDGSTHNTYEEFIKWYADIQKQAVQKLKENRFCVLVVSEIRNKKTGEYRNFVGDNISIMKELGLHYWNECILLNSRGSASLRTNRPFSQTRKITRVHQNVLIFYKGPLNEMRDEFETTMDEWE